MKNITIGQYYPADSILHKLDPRVKFLGTLVFIISLFLIKGLAGYVFVTVVLATLIKLYRLSEWRSACPTSLSVLQS